MAKNKTKDLVHPSNEGFNEKVTPKAPGEYVFFFKCTGCQATHFRHAGYMQVMAPFIRPGMESFSEATRRDWQTVREGLTELRRVLTDPIALAAFFIVALLMVLPWVLSESELTW